MLIHDGKAIVESPSSTNISRTRFSRAGADAVRSAGTRRMRVWSKGVDEILMQSVSQLGWQMALRPLAQGSTRRSWRGAWRACRSEIREKWEITAGRGISPRRSSKNPPQDQLVHRAHGASADEGLARRPGLFLADVNKLSD